MTRKNPRLDGKMIPSKVRALEIASPSGSAISAKFVLPSEIKCFCAPSVVPSVTATMTMKTRKTTLAKTEAMSLVRRPNFCKLKRMSL